MVNNLRVNPLAVQTQDEVDGRLDHSFSEKDNMFVRYTWGGADLTYHRRPYP